MGKDEAFVEVFVALLNVLERARVRGEIAAAIARRQVDELRPVIQQLQLAPTEPPPPLPYLNEEVTQRVRRHLRQWVKAAEAEWASTGLKSLFGPLSETMESIPDLVDFGWETAVQVFTERAERFAVEWFELFTGASAGNLAFPPLAVADTTGEFRLWFWGGLLEEMSLIRAHRKAFGDEPLDLVEDELWEMWDSLMRCLRFLADLQWDVAGRLGSWFGEENLSISWYPYAKRYVDGALDRFDRFRLTPKSPFFGESRSALIEAPDLGVVLAGLAGVYVATGKWLLTIPALSSAELLMDGQVIGFYLQVNHNLISPKRILNEIQHQRRALDQKGRGLSPKEEALLEAVHAEGIRPGQRLPKGFWDEFAKRWNESRERPETVNTLRVRWHRLCKKAQKARLS